MITLQTVATSAVMPSGRNVDILDAATVQANFNTITTESVNIDTKFRALEERMTKLESFMHWAAKHHPDVVHEYVVTEAAKEKIGVK